MSGPAIQALLDDLAEELQRSVVVNDPEVVLRYASRHYGDEDEVRTHAILQRQASSAAVGHVLAQGVARWTTAGVIPPRPEIGMRARVCVPVRWHGELLGLLLVVDADGTLTTADLARMGAAADEVAALLASEDSDHADPASRAREAAVADLLDPSPVVRRTAVRQLAPEADVPHVRVVALDVRPVGEASAEHVVAALRHAIADRAARDRPPAEHLLTTVADSGAALLLGSRAPVPTAAATAYAERLVRTVEEVAVGRFGCVAGLGADVAGLDAAWVSHRQARLAARSAGGVRPEAVVDWADLGPLAVLLRVPPTELDRETLPDELQRVLAADRDGRLVETLRSYLDHAGSVPATADALAIHRTTLYYRLNRIGELTGLDLDDGRTRLTLHLGLTVLDLLET